MDHPTDSAPAPAQPNPKRYWWLKRLSLAALVLIVLIIGLRLIWGHRVQSRLDDLIADIQAQGEPILFSDLQSEPLADSDNGAWYLTQALQQWPNVPTQPGRRITDTDWYNEGEEAGFTDPITDNAAYLASCEAAFDLLRQADQQQQSAWGPGPTRPLFYALMPHLGDNRRLARLVDDVAFRALDAGNTERVFETMLLQHTIARHSHGRYTSLIDSLVAISIMAMNREFIERALPQIDASDLKEGQARELAKKVIARLTDNMLREGFIQGFVGERATNFDLYECLIDGTDTASNMLGDEGIVTFIIDTPGFSHAYRPVLKNVQHLSTQFYTELIQAMRQRKERETIYDALVEIEEKAYNSPSLYPLLGILLPAHDSAISTYHRSETLLHCAATAIAIKLFEADHGKRPDTLDQLVPEYIPAIPVDPFSPTGEPIRYNAQGVTPWVENEEWLNDEQREQLYQASVRPYPVLYSVGEDGTDDLGQWLSLNELGRLNDSNRFNAENYEDSDIWFMLDAWPEPLFEESDIGDVQPLDVPRFE